MEREIMILNSALNENIYLLKKSLKLNKFLTHFLNFFFLRLFHVLKIKE